MSSLETPSFLPSENKVLVVDSGKKLGNLIEKGLGSGVSIDRAASGDTALHIIALQHVDLVITQLRLPLFHALDLASKLKKVRPEIALLAVSTGEPVKDAIELFNLGYPPVIQLPEGEQNLIRLATDILLGNQWLRSVKLVREELKRSFGYDKILSAHPSMRIVYERLKRVTGSKVPVLVTGESGTGKELVARMIHSTSVRSKRPFISVNCAAVPEGLLESQFFGHEKGAFTGAAQKLAGKFELANNGTLFLDEIGEMTPALQAKLLRVIEYGEFERVGGSETVKVDVRLITATNRNLEAMVQAGSFRTDLFYRINVFPIQLPPLRERGEDCILLSYNFLYEASKRNNRQVRAIDSDALELLSKYQWPGNIRELENAIERALLLSDGFELRPVDFQSQADWLKTHFEMPKQADDDDPELLEDFEGEGIRTLAEIERDAVWQAVDAANGNVALAARRLGIARGTLYKKMEEHGLSNREEKNAK